MNELKSLYATIQDRKENPEQGSYTSYLFDKGLDKILNKLGEENTVDAVHMLVGFFRFL